MPPRQVRTEDHNPQTSQKNAQEEFNNILSAVMSAIGGNAPGQRDAVFGGNDPRPGLGDFVPGLAAVTVSGLRGMNKSTRALRDLFKAIERNPGLEDRLNYEWRNIGHSGKVVKPEYLDSGVEASTMKIQPYPRGGEILKIIARGLDEATMFSNNSRTHRQTYEQAPRDLLLPSRLWGQITEQLHYVTQPIAVPGIPEFMQGKNFVDQYDKVRALEKAVKALANQRGYTLGGDAMGKNLGYFRGRPYVIDIGSLGKHIGEVIESDNPRLPR